MMLRVYCVLAAIHLIAIAVTGILWTTIVLYPQTPLKKNFRDIRAVHFGSLYLVPMLLGLAWAFSVLQVPWYHWVPFPAGLGLLVFFAGIAWLFPKPADLDPFYYWTRGPAKVLALIGLACLVIALCWTAVVLVVYALAN